MHPRSTSFFFTKQMREGESFGFQSDSAYQIFVRDAQLLILVFVVAAFVHGLARAIYCNLPRKKKAAKKAGGKKESAPWWQWGQPPPVLSLHARLASAETGGAVLEFAATSLDNFTLSNLVFAVYRCGKLKVAPCSRFLRLLQRIAPAAERLSARGGAHVLWGMARVQPLGEDELARKIAAVVRLKQKDLRPADAVCAVWAALELWPEETEMLACAGSLAAYSLAELVGLLTTLAAHAREAPLAQECVDMMAGKAVATLSLPEQEKLVRALNALRDVLASESRKAILTKVAEGIAASTSARVQPMLPMVAMLDAEDVGPGPFQAVARLAVDSGFAGLSARGAVDLAASMARAKLDGGEEFFLDLAKVAKELSLSADEHEQLVAAFENVGLRALIE